MGGLLLFFFKNWWHQGFLNTPRRFNIAPENKPSSKASNLQPSFLREYFTLRGCNGIQSSGENSHRWSFSIGLENPTPTQPFRNVKNDEIWYAALYFQVVNFEITYNGCSWGVLCRWSTIFGRNMKKDPHPLGSPSMRKRSILYDRMRWSTRAVLCTSGCGSGFLYFFGREKMWNTPEV